MKLSLALLAIAINRSVALSIWELDVQDKLLATIKTLYDCVGDHYDILRASAPTTASQFIVAYSCLTPDITNELSKKLTETNISVVCIEFSPSLPTNPT